MKVRECECVKVWMRECVMISFVDARRDVVALQSIKDVAPI